MLGPCKGQEAKRRREWKGRSGRGGVMGSPKRWVGLARVAGMGEHEWLQARTARQVCRKRGSHLKGQWPGWHVKSLRTCSLWPILPVLSSSPAHQSGSPR